MQADIAVLVRAIETIAAVIQEEPLDITEQLAYLLGPGYLPEIVAYFKENSE